MRPSRGLLALAVLIRLGGAAPLPAQVNTAETLRQAVGLYEDLQVERAVALLRQVVSPSSPFEVSREQRVEAYTYLGASLAILGKRDSAIVYFRAALERTPYIDLDPQRFTETEREALAEARRQTFGLGLRPVTSTQLDPRTDNLTFQMITTHAATVTAEVRSRGAASGTVLSSRELDGQGEIQWNGVLAEGRLAPAGRYELVLRGRSTLIAQSDSARIYFDVRHDTPPLEDTLPALRPEELLPERHAASAAGFDLLKGFGLATAALLLPSVIGNENLGKAGRVAATSVAGVAGTAGVISSIRRQRSRDIAPNIAANRLRAAERALRNAEIRRANDEKLALTKLVVTPAAGIQ